MTFRDIPPVGFGPAPGNRAEWQWAVQDRVRRGGLSAQRADVALQTINGDGERRGRKGGAMLIPAGVERE